MSSSPRETAASPGCRGGGKESCPFCEMSKQHAAGCARRLPKRIILVRHGESQGNLDMSAYSTTPDYRIPLTPRGVEQARATGRGILDVVSSPPDANWKVYFYVSPYERTRATLRGIGAAFPRHRVIGAREECRVREQDFGNFQVEERMRAIKETRERFGRFFFRFPEGESAADVFDRVASKPLPFRFDRRFSFLRLRSIDEPNRPIAMQVSWSRCGGTSTTGGWIRAPPARPTW